MSIHATTVGSGPFKPAIRVFDQDGIAEWWILDGMEDNNEDRAVGMAQARLKRALSVFVSELYAQGMRIARKSER